MDDMEDILKKFVCEMPFMYSDVQTISQWVCCPSWGPDNIRLDSDGKANWRPIDESDDVMKNWTSSMVKNIRKSVVDGSYKYCDHKICPRLNELINTGRKPTLFREIHEFKKVYNIQTEEDIINYKTPPEEILFGFDRSCNLKCPSCRINLIPNNNLQSPQHKAKLHLLKSIEDNFASGLKKIMITGSGDPFYSKIYRDYLINFDVTKYPKLEQLQIITNGNLLDKKLWNQMNATPYIKTIEVSIDAATKDTYETKTRLNGNWDKLIKNLKFLSTQDHIIEQFICSMVVSKHNYKEMGLFYELITGIFKKSNFKSSLGIHYRQIVDWETYSKDDLKDLQVFEPTHYLYNDFLNELNNLSKIVENYWVSKTKFYLNHNFHHLLNN